MPESTANKALSLSLALVDCIKKKKAARLRRKLGRDIRRMARALGQGDETTATLLLNAVLEGHVRKKRN